MFTIFFGPTHGDRAIVICEWYLQAVFPGGASPRRFYTTSDVNSRASPSTVKMDGQLVETMKDKNVDYFIYMPLLLLIEVSKQAYLFAVCKLSPTCCLHKRSIYSWSRAGFFCHTSMNQAFPSGVLRALGRNGQRNKIGFISTTILVR